jgi:ribonuclease G
MSKEMIISVNGREKKIAILTNGEVSEFYIERGDEENSGVVGNIYKGRVMRVLPGMQSAFVDIGLERDAFLYVSDFFDEEEEIERIVMEKSKKSSNDEAEKEATDHVQKQRLKREKQMEEAQDIAEPLAESTKDEEDEDDSKSGKRKSSRRGRSQTSKKQEEDQKEEKSDEKDEQKSDDKPKRGRRGGRGRKTEDKDSDQQDKDSGRKSNKRNDRKESKEEESEDKGFKMPEPVFEFEDSDFERIVDEDADTGDLFKDAYMQEAIVDKVRAIEFDMETTGPAEVGSFMDSVTSDSGSFERIADEDDEDEVEEKPKPKRTTRSRRTKKKTETKTEDKDSEEAEEKKTKTPAKKKTTRRKSTAKSKAKSADDKTEEKVEDKTETTKKTPPKKKTTSRRKAKKAANAEAKVEEKDSTAEMATRRGGRGRRGSSSSNKKDDDNKGNGRSGGKYRGSQPTITELLNEGQEIIVQIAKEPIAKKGARITSHIALPGRFIVYMPTIEHLGVSRKIESANERNRLRKVIQQIRDEEDIPSGGFIVRTAGVGADDDDLRDDARYLVRTWLDIKRDAEKVKSPAVVHQDLDLIQRLLRDQLSNDFSAIRVDSEDEYMRIVEFINRIQPKLVKRVKLHTKDEPILETYNVQDEIEKALKPRVWLKSGGYLVINQTEALVAIDVNTGKFVGKGNARLEETITKTNMEAVVEIARQIRLRDLGGIIVLDLIDMDDRRNRQKVQNALQEALASDKSPNKVLSFNDFGLIIMTRKRVKQSLERTLCTVCDYCEGAGWVKSPQSVCYEILDEARRLSKVSKDARRTTIRVHPDVLTALRGEERPVLDEIEDYIGDVDLNGDSTVHQTQFDFAFV